MENDALAQYLTALDNDDAYRIDAVLKQSPLETTQRVYRIREDGSEHGPYIRKFINADKGLGSAYKRIFEAQQNHERFSHIPGIVECSERDGQLVVVMELVPGETLQDVVYRLDPSPTLATDLFPLICDAVIELHEQFEPPIIHRDLKPTNIIVSQSNVTVIDFGIAREFKKDAATDTTHFGTRSFAPPEQFGFGQTTIRSDVYALGMLLYYCLTEQIPDASTRVSNLGDPRIPKPLKAVIERATEFDPQYRYASVREMKDAFLAACANEMRKPMTSGAIDDTYQAVPPYAIPPTVEDSSQYATPPVLQIDVPIPIVQVQYDQTLPASAQKDDGTSATERHSGGEIWNALLVVATIVSLVACARAFFNPGEQMAQYPLWANAIACFACAPVLIVASAILIADKRPIVERFPTLARLRWYHWVIAWAVIFIAVVLVAGALALVVRF